VAAGDGRRGSARGSNPASDKDILLSTEWTSADFEAFQAKLVPDSTELLGYTRLTRIPSLTLSGTITARISPTQCPSIVALRSGASVFTS
jgi:hypothetical protein